MDENLEFEEFCADHNILITVVPDLSTRIRGYCYYDGIYYNVVINTKFDDFQLRKTTIHEIVHIMRNHFDCRTEDVQQCEIEVKRIIREMQVYFL